MTPIYGPVLKPVRCTRGDHPLGDRPQFGWDDAGPICYDCWEADVDREEAERLWQEEEAEAAYWKEQRERYNRAIVNTLYGPDDSKECKG